MILLVGLDFLVYDKKNCPSHLREMLKFVHELLIKSDIPVFVIHVQ